jgi:hypothetical protein
MYKINQIKENRLVLFPENGPVYEISRDDITGDWIVVSEDAQVQGDWMLTKQDAINYALERAGLIEDANYERAPDRTSA